nr:MAG TPA: hypothetical protein [Caudoviricetes sp.]
MYRRIRNHDNNDVRSRLRYIPWPISFRQEKPLKSQ